MELLKVSSWFVSLGWDESGSITARNILASPVETIKNVLDAWVVYRSSRFMSWACLDLANELIEDGENFSRLEADAHIYRVYFERPYSNSTYFIGFSTENVSNVFKSKTFIQFGFFGDSIDVNVVGRLK